MFACLCVPDPECLVYSVLYCLVFVYQILSGLSVSRQGLSDPEIQELYSVPLHVWNPLYFTLEKFINYQGFMTYVLRGENSRLYGIRSEAS